MLSDANRQRSVAGLPGLSRARRAPRRGARRLSSAHRAADAVKEGTVEAMEKYIAAHPNSSIQTEVTAALRQAMLVALDAVKKAGTVSALTEFSKKHPNKLIENELRQAIHAVYQACPRQLQQGSERERRHRGRLRRAPARRRGKERPEGGDALSPQGHAHRWRSPTRRSSEARFTWARCRCRRNTSTRLTRAARGGGRQDAGCRFAACFPADILALEVGAPVADPEGPLPATTSPHHLHRAFLAGLGPVVPERQAARRLRRLALVFEATFRLPDAGAPAPLQASDLAQSRHQGRKGRRTARSRRLRRHGDRRVRAVHHQVPRYFFQQTGRGRGR